MPSLRPRAADRSNLGLTLDSFHILANGTSFDALADIDPRKIYLVQLSDFMWHEMRSPEDRIDTARHYRVFPGEGVHSEQLADFVRPWTRWVIAATTASRSSTTTSSSCRCP